MSRVPGNEPEDPQATHGTQHSVIRFLEQKIGEAPRVNLREEDSASVSAPVIDPRSEEKLSVPQGRGNYQLLGEIARGGMGVVLRAHDGDLGRDVALKVLDKRLCERMDVVQRFVEEAQIGGQLQHPGIVPVYDLGLMADERPYFTMKLVKGRTLANLLAERETPNSKLGSLVDAFESVCQTMAYAHSRGVIHRDLKPANIMVGAFGEVQVVDWGLAKVLQRGGTADERERQARSEMTILETVRSDGSSTGSESMVGSVLGTPAYMPPEQASGLVDRIDERSDVFALGAILCEILTGHPPYRGERDEIIGAAAQAELDDAFARLDASEADAALVKLTRQCLTAAPAARPANAGVLAERVHDYVISVGERARQAELDAAEAGVRAQEERKARKLTLALGAAVVAILSVGGGGYLWIQNERALQREADAERLQLAVERDRALRVDVDAALKTAATYQGAGRWDDAVLAAERGRGMAEGGGGSQELLASVDSVLADLRGALKAAQEREALRLDTQQLLAELREAAQPNGMEREVEAARFKTTMLAHGIDVDAGDVDDVIAALERRGLGAEVALSLDAWADARRRETKEKGARRLLELAYLIDPDPERAHLREALAERDLDQLRSLAAADLTKQSASTIALLAATLRQLDRRETALAIYRAGVEQFPDDFELVFGLGQLLTPGLTEASVPAELREAARCYRAALSLQPDNPWVRHLLGRIYRRLGEPRNALEQHQRAVDMLPDAGTFRYQLAKVQDELGLDEECRANFEATAELDFPLWMRGWSLAGLSKLAFARGDHDDALSLARKAWHAENSTWVNHVRKLRSFFAVAGVTGDADPAFEASVLFGERFSQSAYANNSLAWELVQFAHGLGSDVAIDGPTPVGVDLLLGVAIEAATRGTKLAPRDAAIWNTLGVARYYNGDFEGAHAALTQEIELSTSIDALTWLPLAMTKHQLGDAEAAREAYWRALSWMVNNADDVTDEAEWFRAEAARVLGLQ
jgi:tetratricopeptide (TPR) repeat protein/tRNA A-37 threonylcarbamoyl transferase component Bud32